MEYRTTSYMWFRHSPGWQDLVGRSATCQLLFTKIRLPSSDTGRAESTTLTASISEIVSGYSIVSALSDCVQVRRECV